MYQIGFGQPPWAPRWGKLMGGGLGPRAQAGTCPYGEFGADGGALASRVRPWVIGTPRRLRLFRRIYGPGSFLGTR
jgi:hypothetical protein